MTIIPWRRLRDIFRVMREPCILGMVVDWGYRADDLPVRLCGAWTTLPAGPATLAARTGAVIVPVQARRESDGTYTPIMYEPIEVTDSSPCRDRQGHPGHRRCARRHGRRSTRTVVHLQAHVASQPGRNRCPGGPRQARKGPRCLISKAMSLSTTPSPTPRPLRASRLWAAHRGAVAAGICLTSPCIGPPSRSEPACICCFRGDERSRP